MQSLRPKKLAIQNFQSHHRLTDQATHKARRHAHSLITRNAQHPRTFQRASAHPPACHAPAADARYPDRARNRGQTPGTARLGLAITAPYIIWPPLAPGSMPWRWKHLSTVSPARPRSSPVCSTRLRGCHSRIGTHRPRPRCPPRPRSRPCLFLPFPVSR